MKYIWLLLLMSGSTMANELKFRFKSPSFTGIGYSAHKINLENISAARKKTIKDELKSLEDNSQIAVTYCDQKGSENDENNPNGALKNIAGIFNKNKNVLGMMPHPERMIDKYLSGEDGS